MVPNLWLQSAARYPCLPLFTSGHVLCWIDALLHHCSHMLGQSVTFAHLAQDLRRTCGIVQGNSVARVSGSSVIKARTWRIPCWTQPSWSSKMNTYIEALNFLKSPPDWPSPAALRLRSYGQAPADPKLTVTEHMPGLQPHRDPLNLLILHAPHISKAHHQKR